MFSCSSLGYDASCSLVTADRSLAALSSLPIGEQEHEVLSELESLYLNEAARIADAKSRLIVLQVMDISRSMHTFDEGRIDLCGEVLWHEWWLCTAATRGRVASKGARLCGVLGAAQGTLCQTRNPIAECTRCQSRNPYSRRSSTTAIAHRYSTSGIAHRYSTTAIAHRYSTTAIAHRYSTTASLKCCFMCCRMWCCSPVATGRSAKVAH